MLIFKKSITIINNKLAAIELDTKLVVGSILQLLLFFVLTVYFCIVLLSNSPRDLFWRRVNFLLQLTQHYKPQQSQGKTGLGFV